MLTINKVIIAALEVKAVILVAEPSGRVTPVEVV